jgi:hypothetical protein
MVAAIGVRLIAIGAALGLLVSFAATRVIVLMTLVGRRRPTFQPSAPPALIRWWR